MGVSRVRLLLTHVYPKLAPSTQNLANYEWNVVLYLVGAMYGIRLVCVVGK